ncbi:hypothetical protein AUK40_05815 [Candidatus Wirthbacteria bacterium CG2_30_54_11]|uniref:Alginate lyase domain-containing protein n=1 Tax=Candidatus Wirthbacteria bacterium CG2_30_54_11 TaxID=1817892 RepID=A0A1J5IWS3_9BACT|nr:MAG: hypothetical protein AUK40_05815 [Candidatus Wirthbacteria bacterium CG2_30_54_11]
MKRFIPLLTVITLIALAAVVIVIWRLPRQTGSEDRTQPSPLSTPIEDQGSSLIDEIPIDTESTPVEWQLNTAKLEAIQALTTGQLLDQAVEDGGVWLRDYQAGISGNGVDDGVREALVMQSLASAYKLTREESYLDAFRRGVAYFEPVIESTSSERGILKYFKVDNAVQANAVALYALAYLDLAEAGVPLSEGEEQTVRGMIEYIAASWNEEAGVFNNYYLNPWEIGCVDNEHNNGYSLALLSRADQFMEDEYFLEIAEQAAQALMISGEEDNFSEANQFFVGGSQAFRQLFEITQKDIYFDYLLSFADMMSEGIQTDLSLGVLQANDGLLDSGLITALTGILPLLLQESPETAARYIDYLSAIFPGAVLATSDQNDPQDFTIGTTCIPSSCRGSTNPGIVAFMFQSAVAFESVLTDEQLQQQVNYEFQNE